MTAKIKPMSIYDSATPYGGSRGLWLERVPAQKVFELRRELDELCIWGGPDRWNFDWENDVVTAHWEYSADKRDQVMAVVARLGVEVNG